MSQQKEKYANMASLVIFGMLQNGLYVLKLNLSGASIALNFNGMVSQKNGKLQKWKIRHSYN